MVDINKLKGAVVANGLTNRQLAKKMGCSEATLYNKYRTGIFNSNEIEFLVKELGIKNPLEIFFAGVVAQEATNTVAEHKEVQ